MVEYEFRDLPAIASYLETRAAIERRSITSPDSKKLRDIQKRERAATYENIADMLRTTALTGEQK